MTWALSRPVGHRLLSVDEGTKEVCYAEPSDTVSVIAAMRGVRKAGQCGRSLPHSAPTMHVHAILTKALIALNALVACLPQRGRQPSPGQILLKATLNDAQIAQHWWPAHGPMHRDFCLYSGSVCRVWIWEREISQRVSRVLFEKLD